MFQTNVLNFRSNIAQQMVNVRYSSRGSENNIWGEREEFYYYHNLLLVDYEFFGQEFAVSLPYHHLSVIAGFLRPESSKIARKFNAYLFFIFVTLSVKQSYCA